MNEQHPDDSTGMHGDADGFRAGFVERIAAPSACALGGDQYRRWRLVTSRAERRA